MGVWGGAGDGGGVGGAADDKVLFARSSSPLLLPSRAGKRIEAAFYAAILNMASMSIFHAEQAVRAQAVRQPTGCLPHRNQTLLSMETINGAGSLRRGMAGI